MNFRFWTRKFWSDIGYGLGSSPWLVRRMVSLADIQGADIIIELGAGYGQVTEYLLAKKSPNTRLIIVENDPDRVAELKRKYVSNCEIYEMSAAHIGELVAPGSTDIIISTLPLGSISSEGVDHILRGAQGVLHSGGRYIQYQYALQNLKDIKRFFIVDSVKFELRNFWPAFIYVTHKK